MSTPTPPFAPPLGVTSPLNACYIQHDPARESAAFARCMVDRLRERPRDTAEWREKLRYFEAREEPRAR
jgi:hypothetical protein